MSRILSLILVFVAQITTARATDLQPNPFLHAQICNASNKSAASSSTGSYTTEEMKEFKAQVGKLLVDSGLPPNLGSGSALPGVPAIVIYTTKTWQTGLARQLVSGLAVPVAVRQTGEFRLLSAAGAQLDARMSFRVQTWPEEMTNAILTVDGYADWAAAWNRITATRSFPQMKADAQLAFKPLIDHLDGLKSSIPGFEYTIDYLNGTIKVFAAGKHFVELAATGYFTSIESPRPIRRE